MKYISLIKGRNSNLNRRLTVSCLSGLTFNLQRAKMDFIEKIRFNSIHNEAKLPRLLIFSKVRNTTGARQITFQIKNSSQPF